MSRPHLYKSSIVVGVTTGILFAIFAIPGRMVRGAPSTWMKFEHGWPLVYLRRQVEGTAVPPPYVLMYRSWRDDAAERPMWAIPWLGSDNWRVWDATGYDSMNGYEPAHWDLNYKPLLIDVLLMSFLVVGVVTLWEMRRRRRPSLWAFNLADVAVATLCVSAVFGWNSWRAREYARELALAEKPYADLGNVPWFTQAERCTAPLWLQSLVGEHLLPDHFWRTSSIVLNADDVSDIPALLNDLSKFRYLSTIEVNELRNSENFQIADLTDLKGLETLEIYDDVDLDPRFVDGLKQLPTLRKVLVSGMDDPQKVIRLQKELPHCIVRDYFEDW